MKPYFGAPMPGLGFGMPISLGLATTPPLVEVAVEVAAAFGVDFWDLDPPVKNPIHKFTTATTVEIHIIWVEKMVV